MSNALQKEEQQIYREQYGKALRMWYAAYKNMRLYSPEHPSMAEASKKAVSAFEEIFKIRFDLTYQLLDGLFLVDDILLIEESLTLYDLLREFEQLAISKITFLPGLTGQEIIDLCSFCIQKKNNFTSEHIRVISITEGTEKNSAPDQPLILDIPRATALSNEVSQVIEKTFTRLMDEQTISPSDLSIPLEVLIDGVEQQAEVFAFLISTGSFQNLNTKAAIHSTVLSIFLGRELGLDVSTLKSLALSALLHDFGRVFLPINFSETESLTAADKEIIRLHPQDGAAFLAGIQGLQIPVVRVALEHHIGFDGKGFPTLPQGQKPHMFSQIVGLADFVSWATVSENRYRKPVAPHRLIRSMLHRSGKQFHPLLVKFLLRFFGLFPPGTIVKLSTGENAIAIKPNQNNIARPLVLVSTPNNKWRCCDIAAIAEDGSFPISIQKTLGFEKNTASIFNQFQKSQTNS